LWCGAADSKAGETPAPQNHGQRSTVAHATQFGVFDEGEAEKLIEPREAVDVWRADDEEVEGGAAHLIIGLPWRMGMHQSAVRWWGETAIVHDDVGAVAADEHGDGGVVGEELLSRGFVRA